MPPLSMKFTSCGISATTSSTGFARISSTLARSTLRMPSSVTFPSTMPDVLQPSTVRSGLIAST